MKRSPGRMLLLLSILQIMLLLLFSCSRAENQPSPAAIPDIKTSPSLISLIPAETTDSSLKLSARIINPVDGAEMILIPKGWFLMGAGPESPEAQSNEGPLRKTYTGAYYIYKYEVTNGQFEKFVKATGYKPTGPWGDEPVNRKYENYPAVRITLSDAAAYCRWAGVTLPTEAQWEKAARGFDGQKYPWGNKWNDNYCNNAKTADPAITGAMRPITANRGTVAAGSIKTDISPFGVMDMAGNINEWCIDGYQADYYKNAPKENPTGPGDDKPERVLKGGSWSLDPKRCRSSARWSGDAESPLGDYGFRCAAHWSFPLEKGRDFEEERE